ncbi:MAG TPA: hypothetical protein VJP79_00250 [Nitrososphaera sp.]|nr:hypothetical protein [Nitrososphaera sp.]
MTPVRFGHADSPTDEDRVLLIELLQKEELTDLVHLLRAKYPPLGSAAIYQYGDVKSDWRATIVYASGPKSHLDYPGLPANTYFGYVSGSLISSHAPSIWLTFNRSSDIRKIELRCLVTYLGSDKQFGGIMSRNATDISELLRSQSCYYNVCPYLRLLDPCAFRNFSR